MQMISMGSDSIKEVRFLSALQISPAGGHAAAVVCKANEDNGYDGHIWLVDEGNIRRLTGLGMERSFIWEDEGHILFPAVRCEKDKAAKARGETTYYRLAVDGGEASFAFAVPLPAVDIKAVEDGWYLVTAYRDWSKPDLIAMAPAEREAYKKATRYEKDYEVVDELPYWSNGGGFTNGKRRRLYLFHGATGEVKPITGPRMQVGGAKVSGCKQFVVYTAQNFDGVQSNRDDLYLYDLATGETRTLFTQAYNVREFAITAHGVIMTASAMDVWGINQNPCIYRVDLHTGETTLLLDRDRSSCDGVASDCKLGGGSTFAVDGGKLWFSGLDGYHANLFSLDLESGAFCQETNLAGSVDCFAIRDGKLLCVAMAEQNLQEIYAVEQGQLRRLTAFNEGYLARFPAVKPERFTFLDRDGVEIDGWVIRPVGFEEGKRYPAILDIHGGPKAAFGEVYYHEMQLWANKGFFVFYCNPRGSEGKGNAFADLRGAYGTYDYEDLMQFTDEVLARCPAIDPNRVGVTGGSYGGFMTNWIIGHTDRFKAAASQRSISNWVSFTYVCDIGYWFGTDQQGATAWSDMEKMWWHSPLKYAEHCKTPTLFIHSDEDYRCWIPEGYQMFTALKLHGVETRMCVFHGENHELSRGGKPEHRIRRLDELTAWFERHLG